MFMRNTLLTLTATAALSAATTAQAALLEWNFPADHDETADDVLQTSKDAAMDDATLSRANGLIGDPNREFATEPNAAYTSKAQNSETDAAYTLDINTAMGNGQFISFTASAPSMFMTIDGVTVDQVSARGDSNTTQLALFSSVGGFAAGDELAIASIGSSLDWDATGLSEFENLTDPIEFRLLWLRDGGNNFDEVAFGVKGDDMADVQVNGSTTVIPEPASLALFALGGLAILRRRSE